MKQQLLLIEDVECLGKKGELVTARPGYVRNYLLPQGLAVVATANTIRKQERLRAERAKQAVIDRKESEELAAQIDALAFAISVKVDPEGHMYGSVSAADIAALMQEKGLPVDKRNIQVTKPIKVTGAHKISVKLKEGIMATCNLSINPEGVVLTDIEEVIAPIASTEEASAE